MDFDRRNRLCSKSCPYRRRMERRGIAGKDCMNDLQSKSRDAIIRRNGPFRSSCGQKAELEGKERDRRNCLKQILILPIILFCSQVGGLLLKTIRDKIREMDERIDSLEIQVRLLQDENRRLQYFLRTPSSEEAAETPREPMRTEAVFQTSDRKTADFVAEESAAALRRQREDLFEEESVQEPVRQLPPGAVSEAARESFTQKEEEENTDAAIPRGERLRTPRPVRSAFVSDEEKKDRESLVGKYLIGALASLLIFIGAASFVAIIWNRISPQMKLTIICTAGLLLTAVGLRISVKKPGVIPSILMGTGSGLVYIGILSASLAFHLVSDQASILLCGVWTLALMFSYRFTGLSFTVFIAYIGSYINLLFQLPGAAKADSGSGYLLLLFLVTAVSGMMLFTLRREKGLRYRIGIFLAGLSYLTLFEYIRSFDSAAATVPAEIGCVLAFILLKNLLYEESESSGTKYLHFILSIISSYCLVVLIVFSDGFSARFNLRAFQGLLIIFAVHGIQFFANGRWYRRIERELSFYYGTLLYLTGVLIAIDRFRIPAAAPVVVGLFFLRKFVSKSELPLHFLALLIGVDSLLLATERSLLFGFWKDGPAILSCILNTTLLFFLPKAESRPVKNPVFLKNLSLVVLLINCGSLSEHLIHMFPNLEYGEDYGALITHLLCLFSLIVLYRTGYFVWEETEDEKRRIPGSLYRYAGFLICSVILFVIGADQINDFYAVSDGAEWLMMLIVTAMSLLQMKAALACDHRLVSNGEGIWLLLKFTVFSIACLNGIFVMLFALSHGILILRELREKYENLRPLQLKNLSLLTLLIACFPFSHKISGLTGWGTLIPEIGTALAFLLASALLLAVFKLRYIREEDSFEGRKGSFFGRLPWYGGIYFFATVIYLLSLVAMNDVTEIQVKALLTLCALVTGLFQSYLSLSGRKEVSRAVGIWLVIKYLAMLWSVIHAFLDLPADSVVYSVSGLILAVAAIYFGFRRNIQVTRHFGLVLTLTMVAKFILVDLRGENSITRVVAFVAGGILCFLISILYNRLSKN